MGRTVLFSKLKRALRQAHREEFPSQGRRQFLRQAALASTLPVLGSLNKWGIANASSTPEPVLILGAGAAGLAAAYRLKKAGVPFQILESTTRVGGRIFTCDQFNSDGQFVERGAEYIDTNQETLIGLAAELGVEIENFGEGLDIDNDYLYFIQGRYRTEQELGKVCRPLVKAIHQARKKIFPNEVIDITYRTASQLPEAIRYDQMTLAQFLEGLKGQVEEWALEAVRITFKGEYGIEVEEQSALNLLTLMGTGADDSDLLGDSDETKRIKGGNSRLMERLLQAVIEPHHADHVLRLGCRVVSIRKDGSQIVVTAQEGQSIREFKASQVITTVPFSVMREWDGLQQLGLSSVKLKSIREMTYGTNSKVFLGFDQRFWHSVPKNRQWKKGMAYDRPTQLLWEATRRQEGQKGVLTFFLSGREGRQTDAQSVRQAQKDLQDLYPHTAISVKDSSFYNWSRVSSAKGSYTGLSVGQWTSIWGAAAESELKGQLLFAGEHASLAFQGYMNGALETGIRAAEQISGVRKQQVLRRDLLTKDFLRV